MYRGWGGDVDLWVSGEGFAEGSGEQAGHWFTHRQNDVDDRWRFGFVRGRSGDRDDEEVAGCTGGRSWGRDRDAA